jgi:hypothetical protein
MVLGSTLTAEDLGWSVVDGMYMPIATDLPAAPAESYSLQVSHIHRMHLHNVYVPATSMVCCVSQHAKVAMDRNVKTSTLLSQHGLKNLKQV